MEWLMLDSEHKVITTTDAKKWGEWYTEASNRRVAVVEIPRIGMVSTMFVGSAKWLDVLPYETMFLLRDPAWGYDQFQMRFSTWAEAEAGHKKLLAWLLTHCPNCGGGRLPEHLTCRGCGCQFVPFNKFQFVRTPRGTKVWVRP